VGKLHAVFRLSTGCCLLLLSFCATVSGCADSSASVLTHNDDQLSSPPAGEDCILVVDEAKPGEQKRHWVRLAEARTVRQLIESRAELQPGARERSILIFRWSPVGVPLAMMVEVGGINYEEPLQAGDQVMFHARP
jgi:hypothetical protein